MKSKKLLLIVSLVLALTMSLGGTLAYLTDTDDAVNVMTLGNVQIEQIELQRKDGVAYNATATGSELEAFKVGQSLYPAYPHNNAATDYSAEQTDLFKWGPYVTADSDEANGTAASNGLWNDSKLTGALDKFVFVKNTGTSDCYYRTIIAFECPAGMEYSEGPDKEFMMNINGNSRFTWTRVDDYIMVNDVRYLVYVAQYNQALPAGKISRPSLLQVVMTHNATSEDMELLGENYEIIALTQACQTVNMPENAAQALNVAFGEANSTNVADWLGGVEMPELYNWDDVTYVKEGETVRVISNGGTKIWRNILAESGEFAGVKNLVIGEGITTIGYRALKDSTTLESVTLASTVTSIEGGAFQGCSNLKEFTIPSTITSIEESTFRNTGLTEIIIPANINAIGAHAFRGTPIETITIPATVKTIGQYAFRECKNLRTIYIEGDDVTFVGSGIFSNRQDFNSGNFTVYVQNEAMKTAVEEACGTNASGVVTVIVQP